jgi:type IV secretory pathway VirB4 component
MAAPQKTDFGNSLDLVDIDEIRGNVVVMKDTSLKQIVMVGGVNFALKSETEQNIITQGYQNFLNSIDFPLQIVIHSRKVNVDVYIQNLLARKDVEESPLLRSQIDEYAEFIKGFILKNAIMEKTFLVVVPYYPTSFSASAGKKAAASLLPSFMGGKKSAKGAAAAAANKVKTDAEAAQDYKEHVVQLEQRTGQVMSGLAGIGLEVTVLENDALIELFYNFYNPQTVERENMNVGGGATAGAGEAGATETGASGVTTTESHANG